MIENGIAICTNVHSAISNSERKGITFLRVGKTINITINIEIKGNIKQYGLLFTIPKKFCPQIGQLFQASGIIYLINSINGNVTCQQPVTTGKWIQISCSYQH